MTEWVNLPPNGRNGPNLLEEVTASMVDQTTLPRVAFV